MPNPILVGTEVYDIPFGMYARVIEIVPESAERGPHYLLEGDGPTCEAYPDRWRTEYEVTTAVIYKTPHNNVGERPIGVG